MKAKHATDEGRDSGSTSLSAQYVAVLLRLRSSNSSVNVEKLIERIYRIGNVGGVLRVKRSRPLISEAKMLGGMCAVLLGAATYRSPSSPPRTSMSAIPSTSSTSHSDFLSIFNAALENYKNKTKKDISSHPLLAALQSCDSPEAILAVLREQIPAFNQSQNGDDRLTKWVTPTVNVLYSFSATIGGGVGLVNIRMFPREEFLL